MKKLFAVILCALMLVTMAVSASAAVSYKEAKPTGLGTVVFEKGVTLSDITETKNITLKADTEKICCKTDKWVRYEFTAEKAGTYTFVIDYIARTGNNRALDYAIDDMKKSVFCDLVESADHRYAVITEELEAGKHSFYIMPPTGFDDSTLKSCDVYGVSAYFTKAAAAAPAASAQTADPITLAAAALAVSGAAAVILKKKH